MLKKLNIVQAKAVRICSGSFCTTPVSAVLVQMGETSLNLRKTKPALHYWVKVQVHRSDFPTSCLLNQHWEFSGKSRKRKHSYVNTVGQKADEVHISKVKMGPVVCWSPITHWLIPQPEVELDILTMIRDETLGDRAEGVSQHQKEVWGGSRLQIYSDGSKDPVTGKTAFGVYIQDY